MYLISPAQVSARNCFSEMQSRVAASAGESRAMKVGLVGWKLIVAPCESRCRW